MLKNKVILVTGAEGFIGSHLVEALRDLGANVRALCLYNSFSHYGWLETINQEGLDIRMGDVRDASNMRTLMQNVDIVFHLAALIAIPYSYLAPEAYIETNIKGTLNVLNAARETGAQVIITSTSEVYGTAKFVPITEEHPLQGQSPYAATKIGADQLALSFQKSFDMNVSLVRPFNTFGPRQSARAVIPTIISQIAAGKREIKLGDMTTTRDFNFVEDTAQGFMAVAKCKKAKGEVVNLATNSEYTIAETAALIAKIMGVKIEILTDNQRMRPAASEVERLWGCNAKAKALTGWSPQVPFDKGLEKTVEWFMQPQNLAHYKPEIYNV